MLGLRSGGRRSLARLMRYQSEKLLLPLTLQKSRRFLISPPPVIWANGVKRASLNYFIAAKLPMEKY